MTTEEMIFEEGRQKGVTEIITRLAEHQGMSIEQACKMCGHDDEKVAWVLECVSADAARIAAEERAKELQTLSDYLLEPIKDYSCPERGYFDPPTTTEQQAAARRDLLELKKRIAEMFNRLAMPRMDSKPHLLQEYGNYGYRLLQLFTSLQQEDFEWACRVLKGEIARCYGIYDIRTALAILKILEIYV